MSPSQIRPSSVSGQVLTTVTANVPPSWQNPVFGCGSPATGYISCLVIETKTSPHVDITWFGASPAASPSANVTAIQNAINYAMSIGGDVFTPCGTFQTNAMLTTYGAGYYTAPKFTGQGRGCSIWQYVGSSPVSAVLMIASDVSGTIPLSQVTVQDMNFIGNQNITLGALSAIDGSQDLFLNISAGPANNTTGSAFYFAGIEYPAYINLSADGNQYGVEGFTAGQNPYSGFTIDTFGGACPGPATITSLTVQSLGNSGTGGKAVNIICAADTTATGLQISNNYGTNLYIGPNSRNNSWSGLDEPVSGITTVALLSTDGGGQHFKDMFVGGSGSAPFHISGDNGDVVEGGSQLQPVVIDSGTNSTSFKHVEISDVANPPFSDAGTGTTYTEIYDASGNTGKSTPWNCTVLPLTSGFAGPGSLIANGGWGLNTSTYTPICPNNLGAPAHWEVVFNGVFQQGGCTGTGAGLIIQVTDAAPTIACGSQTFTVALNAGILGVKITGGSGSNTFNGQVQFYPQPNGGAAQAINWLGSVSLQGILYTKLPTSCSGLASGTLYNNSGTPAICP